MSGELLIKTHSWRQVVPTLLLFLHGEGYLVEGIGTQGSVKG